MARTSAGVVLYRRTAAGIEVLIAHPGGPFWRNRDQGAWTIPKGEIEPGEDLLAAALREFAEETGNEVSRVGAVDLGSITQRAGKIVHAWGIEGDLDPASHVSNPFEIEWPPRSGRTQSFPEIDQVAWVAPDVAAAKLNPALEPLIRRLEDAVGG